MLMLFVKGKNTPFKTFYLLIYILLKCSTYIYILINQTEKGRIFFPQYHLSLTLILLFPQSKLLIMEVVTQNSACDLDSLGYLYFQYSINKNFPEENRENSKETTFQVYNFICLLSETNLKDLFPTSLQQSPFSHFMK